MRTNTIQTTCFGSTCQMTVMEFDKNDGIEWKKVFDQWKGLKLGLKSYKAREPNFPEGLSEVAFCLWSQSSRYLSSKKLSNTSFDTFNTNTNRAEQIKACSVEQDLTSFGPKSRWDDLYFLDFFNGGLVDGCFDIYKIPSDLIYNHKVNKNQTLKEMQALGKRPRFSIKKHLVVEMNLKPIAKKVQVWLN